MGRRASSVVVTLEFFLPALSLTLSAVLRHLKPYNSYVDGLVCPIEVHILNATVIPQPI